MNKERLIAFTDAIIAIIVTILILELPKPQGANWSDFFAQGNSLLAYAVSFVLIIGVWVNHHNLFEPVTVIDKKAFWANALWLFFQSFIPYTTSWIGEYPGESGPVLLLILMSSLWTLSYRLIYISLSKTNDMPMYPIRRTIWYIVVYGLIAIVASWHATTALWLLFFISLWGLRIRKKRENRQELEG